MNLKSLLSFFKIHNAETKHNLNLYAYHGKHRRDATVLLAIPSNSASVSLIAGFLSCTSMA